MSKRYNDPIEVVRSSDLPVSSFSWRGKSYTVDHLLKHWVETKEGWDPELETHEEYFRVEADGGTYDLLFDRLSELSVSESGKPPPAPSTAPTGNEGGAGGNAMWRLARVWD